MSAVYGDSENELIFSSAGTVYHSDPSYEYGNEPLTALFSVLPELEWDSWLTIGMMTGSDNGTIANVGMDDAMDSFDTTGDIYLNDPTGGAWFYPGFPPCGNNPVAECATQYSAFGGGDNKVLLAQITTDGSFTGVFNVQVFVVGDQENAVNYTGIGFSTDSNEVFGCTDPLACNFDPLADTDDGSCSYDDADGNGICDDDEILGCTVAYACNYNSDANVDDGSCDYTSCYVFGCDNIFACNYDPLVDYNDDSCDFTSCAGCTDITSCDDDEILGCTVAVACNYNSDANVDDGSCDYTSCYVFGCDNTFACNYDPLVDYDDGSCDFETCAGCTDNTSCDYDPTATISDAASCVDFTSCYGCMDSVADNYDPTATIDDEDCLYYGCTLSVACNYYPTANTNDGSCEFTSCAGCLTPTACNYDPTFIYHNASDCISPDYGYDCDGVCLLDTDGDGVCNMFEIPGCTDITACNYNIDATDDDGSCTGSIPDGDCDCDGNVLDGCGVCNGPGAIYECGCTELPSSDCDCGGIQLDALNICGGDCDDDLDDDGVCDDIDDCVGEYDSCSGV